VNSITLPSSQTPAAIGEAIRQGAKAPARPQPRSHDESFAFGGLVPQQPPPAPLVALLLGLLALAAPRTGGRRLHPAVALLRPGGVPFRLVRPG
jgi:hypothetical protein